MTTITSLYQAIPNLANGSVRKEDINITDIGHSVITKIIAGDNIVISSSGADSGTGEVTISANLNAQNSQTYVDYLSNNIQSSKRPKLNFINTSEIGFSVLDDKSNNQANVIADIRRLDFNKLRNIPTTLAGFGITDSVSATIFSQEKSYVDYLIGLASKSTLATCSLILDAVNPQGVALALATNPFIPTKDQVLNYGTAKLVQGGLTFTLPYVQVGASFGVDLSGYLSEIDTTSALTVEVQYLKTEALAPLSRAAFLAL